MLSLKELRFSGIGRFVEEQVIDFTKLGSLVQVDGENKNTGGSSGAGKTTVFNALDFLFGLNDVSNSILQSRLTKNHISVTGKFEIDGKPLTISRGKKLSIDHDGAVVTGSSKLAEEKLISILGMPKDIFRPMLHKRQKEGGFFLKFTPREMNEFLVDCLGLSEFTSKLTKIDDRLMELGFHRQTNAGLLENTRASLTATQNALQSIGLPPTPGPDESTLASLANTASVCQIDYRLLHDLAKSEKQNLEAERPLTTTLSPDRSKIVAYQSELKMINAELQAKAKAEWDRQTGVNSQLSDLKAQKAHLTNQIVQMDMAKRQAPTLALEIKRIRENSCPTCEQSWATEKTKEHEAAIMAKLRLLKETIDLGAKASEALVAVEVNLRDLSDQRAAQTPQGLGELTQKESELNSLIKLEEGRIVDLFHSHNLSNKLAMDKFILKQKELSARHDLLVTNALNRSFEADKAYEAAKLSAKAYDEAITRYDTSKVRLIKAETVHQEKLVSVTAFLKTLDDEIELLNDLKRAVKSFISCSFDDALVSIGEVATRIIRSIPNMANATIQLEGTRETNDGKVKEEVNAVIHSDGEESIPIKSLSGGERSSVDLAVDLAVLDLLENKTNKGIDVFVLDEAFTGMDTVGIEMALEVLKNSNVNKKIIIVDHNPIIKEMVGSRLVVVRDGETSTLQ